MDLQKFLKQLKLSIKLCNYDLVPTIKNRNSRRKYGFSLLDMEQQLYNLEASDLYQGPVLDHDFPGEYLYIFKKEVIPNVIFYIKVKYKNDQIKILSYHEDE